MNSEIWKEIKLENCVEILDSRRIPINNDERQKRINGKQYSELFPYYGATGEVGKIDDFIFDEELVALGEDGVPFFDSTKNKAYLLKGKTWVNNHAHVLKAIDGISLNKFILHYLNIFNYKNHVNGGTRLKLTQENMRKIPVPLPPLAEQKEIAAQLDNLLAQVDTIKSRLDKIPAIIKKFRQSVLSAAVTGKLTEEWRKGKEKEKNWATKGLSELGELSRGKSKHRPRNDARLFGDKYPFIQTGEIANSGGKIFKAEKFYSEFGYSQSRLFPKGTLCITIAANIADTAILEIDACFPDSIVGFIPFEDKCRVEFIKYFIDVKKGNLEELAPATAQKNINLKILNEILLPSPLIEEQHEIVRRVEELFAFADQIEARLSAAKKQVDMMTQSILAKAFRGDLTAKWREENPHLITGENSAERLLERIKREKEKSDKKEKNVKKSKDIKSEVLMRPKEIIPIIEALKNAQKPLETKELFELSGYPSDAETDIVEKFFLDIREQLRNGNIVLERKNNNDIFSIKSVGKK